VTLKRCATVPDETTFQRFRHLLGATLIKAPSSTKNASKQREMHQTRKRQGWWM